VHTDKKQAFEDLNSRFPPRADNWRPFVAAPPTQQPPVERSSRNHSDSSQMIDNEVDERSKAGDVNQGQHEANYGTEPGATNRATHRAEQNRALGGGKLHIEAPTDTNPRRSVRMNDNFVPTPRHILPATMEEYMYRASSKSIGVNRPPTWEDFPGPLGPMPTPDGQSRIEGPFAFDPNHPQGFGRYLGPSSRPPHGRQTANLPGLDNVGLGSSYAEGYSSGARNEPTVLPNQSTVTYSKKKSKLGFMDRVAKAFGG
jgi:hypothetical protein